MRVLIVDENELTREVVAMILRHDGNEATLSSSLEEARSALASARYNVVLSDLDTDEGHPGPSLLDEVFKFPPCDRPAFIALSGRDPQTRQRPDARHQPDLTLRKPLDARAVRSALETARSSRLAS